MIRNGRIAAGLLVLAAGCGTEGGEPGGASEALAPPAALEQALEGDGPSRVTLPPGRFDVAGLVLRGNGLQVVGGGAAQTTLEGPLRLDNCARCTVQDVTLVSGEGGAALVQVHGGGVLLQDVRMEEHAVGLESRAAEVTLERVWSRATTVAIRTEDGGHLNIRHSILEGAETAIEAHAETEVSLIDNLFAEVRGCLVRDTAATRSTPLNAVFGNLRTGESDGTTEVGCLAVPTLSLEDADAAPVLVELRQSEALRGAPVLKR